MVATKISLFIDEKRPKAKIYSSEEFIDQMRHFGVPVFFSPRVGSFGKSEAEKRGFIFPEESQQEDLLVVGTPRNYIVFFGGGVEVFYGEYLLRQEGVYYFADFASPIFYKEQASSLMVKIIDILTEGKREIFYPFPPEDPLIFLPSTMLFLSELKELIVEKG